jgi:hypothetical protein
VYPKVKFRQKTPKEKRFDRTLAGAILLALLILCFWYVKAESIFDKDVPGTYAFHQGQIAVLLTITPDHRFQEEVRTADRVARAEGTWHIFGEGRIEFSKEFIVLPGQEICYENPSCGSISNSFGFMSIRLGLNPPGLRFRKNPFG